MVNFDKFNLTVNSISPFSSFTSERNRFLPVEINYSEPHVKTRSGSVYTPSANVISVRSDVNDPKILVKV